ncbi:hypothetical protein [Nitrospira sp. Nam74]
MAKNKHKKKPPKYLIQPSQHLTLDSRSAPPLKPVHTPLTVSFIHIKAGSEYCLSHCEKPEVKAVMNSLRLLTTMSWLEVMNTGGKPHGGKVGLGYTPYPHLTCDGISKDCQIAGIRASDEFRIFGFHMDHVFHVLWFDPHHEIVPT